MIKLRTAALTDIGRVREENEDRFLCDDVLRLYAVADGIGGLPAGAQAAQLAVDALDEAVRALPAGAEPDWRHIVQEVSDRVRKLGQIIDGHAGIGCTLTLAQVRGGLLQLAHVGDSTCYLLRTGQLKKLTTDHNVENELRQRVPAGAPLLLSVREAQALTRCIGQPMPLAVDVMTRPLAAGDRVLLCSDGITRMIPDNLLAQMMAAAGSPEALLKNCVEEANGHGGFDNSTGVTIFVDEV